MLHFPPIPNWDALHPLIIHFPIALLLIAPIFVVVGAALTPPRGDLTDCRDGSFVGRNCVDLHRRPDRRIGGQTCRKGAGNGTSSREP